MQTIRWDSFRNYFKRVWQRGEHVSIIGPTGSGKSLLAMEIMRLREHTVLFLTKKEDKTASKFIQANDYEVITQWPPSAFDNKIALWPKFRNVESYEIQHKVFYSAINGNNKYDGIFSEGEWTILVDEVMYFVDELGLEKSLKMLWTQGRSTGISLVAGTQRPREIPQQMLNQWTHLFIFQTSDEYEIDRLKRVGGNIGPIIKKEVPNLPEHYFMYIHRTRRNDVFMSKVVK